MVIAMTHVLCCELAQDVGFGYNGPLDSKLIIGWHVQAFLRYSNNSINRHLEHVVKEFTSPPVLVKKLIWGYPLTRHQCIILMFYDVDFLIKTVDQVLKQNKLNSLYQPGYFDEARHRIAMPIEYIGAPMQNGTSKV